MFLSLIVIGILLCMVLFSIWHSFMRVKEYLRFEEDRFLDKVKDLEMRHNNLKRRYKELESKLNDIFFVYELARKISPLLEKEKLLQAFKDEVKEFEGVKLVDFSDTPSQDMENFELRITSPRYVRVRLASAKAKEYFSILLNQLNLCLERISLYTQFQELSIHDSLTGAYNRRYFMERFHEEIERAKKFAFKFSFLMVDIDFFKSVNDTYGHIVGDVVLREVARILKENLREIDFLARYGGEEFAIILTETDKVDAIMVAKRIVRKVAHTPIRAFDEVIKVTVSIGLASYPENTRYPDMLIEVADRALYKAKESGRNIASWF